MLCIMGKVQFDRETKERCPKTPLHTLTTIIKPLSNKGKEKMKEIEEGGRDNGQTEQAIVVSPRKTREERKRSASPIGNCL